MVVFSGYSFIYLFFTFISVWRFCFRVTWWLDEIAYSIHPAMLCCIQTSLRDKRLSQSIWRPFLSVVILFYSIHRCAYGPSLYYRACALVSLRLYVSCFQNISLERRAAVVKHFVYQSSQCGLSCKIKPALCGPTRADITTSPLVNDFDHSLLPTIIHIVRLSLSISFPLRNVP